jgi:hypothetical protein
MMNGIGVVRFSENDSSWIEFCIRDDYCFWVFRFDRDPKMIILSKQTIENLFIL